MTKFQKLLFGYIVCRYNSLCDIRNARYLYERLGFVQLGTIPGGFKMKDGHYENICPYYHTLYFSKMHKEDGQDES